MRRASQSRQLRIYRVNVTDEQSSSSSSSSLSSPAAAAAVYDTANVDQVTVTENQLSLDLPLSFFTSSAIYAVLLETGNYYY